MPASAAVYPLPVVSRSATGAALGPSWIAKPGAAIRGGGSLTVTALGELRCGSRSQPPSISAAPNSAARVDRARWLIRFPSLVGLRLRLGGGGVGPHAVTAGDRRQSEVARPVLLGLGGGLAGLEQSHRRCPPSWDHSPRHGPV